MISCANIPLRDKGCHAIAGFIVGSISMYFIGVWAIASVFLVAVLKEIYDLVDYGDFDFIDIAYTLLGGAIGIILIGVII